MKKIPFKSSFPFYVGVPKKGDVYSLSAINAMRYPPNHSRNDKFFEGDHDLFNVIVINNRSEALEWINKSLTDLQSIYKGPEISFIIEEELKKPYLKKYAKDGKKK